MGRHGDGHCPLVHLTVHPTDLNPAEGSMTSLATTVPIEIDHQWELRLEEFEDGQSIRRFECVDCGAVRFE
jgi:hypothetical protein